MRRIAVSGLYALLAGCAVGPDFHSPAPGFGAATALTRYTEQAQPERTDAAAVDGGAAQSFAVGRDIVGDWWTLFRNPALSGLVATGLRDNPGIEAARQALRQAQELTLAQYSGLLPNVTGQVYRERGNFPAAATGIPNTQFSYGYYDAQLTLGYNFDLWGGVRRSIEQQAALTDAERALLEATDLTLTGNIVATAINEASLRGQISVQRQVIDFERHYLATVQSQFALGGATGTDVALQQSQEAQQEALLPPLLTALTQARDALAADLGTTPQAAGLPVLELDQLSLPEALPVSLPVALLEQRPDVRQAEANLHAATAAVGIAIANRLPQVTLSAALGTEAVRTSQLLTPGNGLATLLTQAVQPIFEGGLLLHQQRAAVAAMRERAAQWRQTALGAIQNIADTLVQIQQDSDLLVAQLAAEQAAAKSLALAKLQYGFGGVAYLTVLQAEITFQTAANGLIRARANRYADSAALYVARGGGWWNRRDEPPPPADVVHSLLPWSAS